MIGWLLSNPVAVLCLIVLAYVLGLVTTPALDAMIEQRHADREPRE